MNRSILQIAWESGIPREKITKVVIKNIVER